MGQDEHKLKETNKMTFTVSDYTKDATEGRTSCLRKLAEFQAKYQIKATTIVQQDSDSD